MTNHEQGRSAKLTGLEVGEEEVRLVALHLPVLDGAAAEVVIQLDGEHGRGARLVLHKRWLVRVPQHSPKVLFGGIAPGPCFFTP